MLSRCCRRSRGGHNECSLRCCLRSSLCVDRRRENTVSGTHPTYVLLLITTYCMKLGRSAVDRRRRARVSRRSRRDVLCVCSRRSVGATRARCAGIVCVVDGDDPRWRRRRSTVRLMREIQRSTCGANATRSTVIPRESNVDTPRIQRGQRDLVACCCGPDRRRRTRGSCLCEGTPHVRIVAVAKRV